MGGAAGRRQRASAIGARGVGESDRAGNPPLVWIGLISYPLYLWHWPLLVFGETIKFRPLTLLERDLILLASTLLAWATYRFVEIPFRFGLPSRRKMFSLGAGMAMVAVAGMAVIWGRGFDFRLPPEIRAMASVQTESFKWRVHECLLDLSRKQILPTVASSAIGARWS